MDVARTNRPVPSFTNPRSRTSSSTTMFVFSRAQYSTAFGSSSRIISWTIARRSPTAFVWVTRKPVRPVVSFIFLLLTLSRCSLVRRRSGRCSGTPTSLPRTSTPASVGQLFGSLVAALPARKVAPRVTPCVSGAPRFATPDTQGVLTP